MSVITFERKKLDTTNTYTATVAVGSVASLGNDFYIPVTLDNFVVPDITLTAVSGVNGTAILSNTGVDYFKDLKVGDIVSTGLTTVVSSAVNLADIALTEDSTVFVYPATFNSMTLPLEAGDSLSSTSLPSGTKVDRIDYVNKLVFMSQPADATQIETIAISKPVRVLSKNANSTEITLSKNLSAAVTNGTVVFKRGATEALLGMIKIAPVGSNSNGNVSIQVSGYKNSGENITYGPNGSGYNAPQNYNYVNLGNLTFDADEFLADAGIPRA